MRIFICTLVFIFMIFLNSVQSMNNGGDSSIKYRYTPRRQLRLRQIVYLRGHPQGSIYKLLDRGMREILPEWEANQIWTHWEQLPFSQGERNLENGDLLIRKRKPIAKLQGVSFHGIAPDYPGQEIVQPKNDDMVFRLGNPIAKYENKVRRRIDFIDYTNNDDWLGHVEADEL